ncbi:hypothetical protein ABZ865_11700 [Streptomyces sp. NPDC047085]|uniref:hypothetical protein n=1 Tax=Streptomyces sp. NPDC047085 TaxID=3155140 RepID=UPI0033CF7CC5
MPASRPTEQPTRPVLTGVSMRDLLASCAAADAVSRPPHDPEPGTPGAPEPAEGHRDAA